MKKMSQTFSVKNMGKEQSPNDQCCGSALVSMRIRIQLFFSKRIKMRIQAASKEPNQCGSMRIQIRILVRLKK